jgi:(4-(4-[2-(gamma-L-glutamylamino)ethyl]phenoxymethyl)furan-2-yl)methanamine synthase
MTSESGPVIGWDVGGVNTKAVIVTDTARPIRTVSLPYEIQYEPAALVAVLHRLSAELGATGAERHAVTMTAELSQLFRTKREGVSTVLDAFAAAFGNARVGIYSVAGEFLSPADARRRHLEVAASNWSATAVLVSRLEQNAILIDIGTTTTDIIPIEAGRVAALGHTDPERLLSGELVYTGAVRTPAEALLTSVPLPGGPSGVSAEGFALTGDALLWLGRLDPSDYTARPPDGRPATREFAGERLARFVCADRELLDAAAVGAIASAIAEAQLARIITGIDHVRARHPALSLAVVAGIGDFIATEAASRAGLLVSALSDRLGSAARTAPAAAVALLMHDQTADPVA